MSQIWKKAICIKSAYPDINSDLRVHALKIYEFKKHKGVKKIYLVKDEISKDFDNLNHDFRCCRITIKKFKEHLVQLKK